MATAENRRERMWSLRTALAVVVALLVLPLVLAPHAEAYVYWTSPSSIGRANFDGSGVDQSFVTGVGGSSFGVAVDAGHVYWANFSVPSSTGSIGRASLDGSGVNFSFIASGYPHGIAVDAEHVYWASGGSIGRANLDGTHVDKNFITSAAAFGVAVDARHVYWTTVPASQRIPPTPPSHPGSIGRANLDGSGADQSFIADAGFSPLGVAVNAGHIYWVDENTNSIARARLDGTHVDKSIISGTHSPYGVAVNSRHVYWTNLYAGSIGRAKLDGSGVNQSFITGAHDPWGVAVDSLPDTKPPKTKITKGAPKKTDKRKVNFKFKSSEPNSTFECKLDKKKFKPCESPKKVKIDEGKHKFKVRAIDVARNVDPTPAKDKFRVVG
jgi:virginiamycin B lyase